MDKAAGLSSRGKALISFLLGAAVTGGPMVIMPRAFVAGYLPASWAMSFLPMMLFIAVPYAISLCAVLVVSGEPFLGKRSTLEERLQSAERFWPYMKFWFLGSCLTGFALSVFRLLTAESYFATHLFVATFLLLGIFVSLWIPNPARLRRKWVLRRHSQLDKH